MAGRDVVVSGRAVSEAAPEAVWALLADHSAWPRWSTMRTATLEREGDPPPDGVGAVRVFRNGPFGSREQVEVWEPGRRFGYTLLSGLPVDDYHSVVELAAGEGGGTVVTWTSRFRTRPLSGWLMKPFIQFIVRDFSRRVAKAAAAGPG